jgi:hypothetical protein
MVLTAKNPKSVSVFKQLLAKFESDEIHRKCAPRTQRQRTALFDQRRAEGSREI